MQEGRKCLGRIWERKRQNTVIKHYMSLNPLTTHQMRNVSVLWFLYGTIFKLPWVQCVRYSKRLMLHARYLRRGYLCFARITIGLFK